MNYRRLGRSGLQVSELSLGSWVTYHNQVDVHAAKEMMAAAYDGGVNFWSTAGAQLASLDGRGSQFVENGGQVFTVSLSPLANTGNMRLN